MPKHKGKRETAKLTKLVNVLVGVEQGSAVSIINDLTKKNPSKNATVMSFMSMSPLISEEQREKAKKHLTNNLSRQAGKATSKIAKGVLKEAFGL